MKREAILASVGAKSALHDGVRRVRLGQVFELFAEDDLQCLCGRTESEVVGASRVARFLANLTQRYHDQLTISAVTVNGEPGIVGRLDGQIDFVAAFEMWRDAVVTVRLVRNPDKLRLVECAKRLL